MGHDPVGGDERVRAHVARLAELGVMTASLLHELRQPLFALRATVELQVASGAEGAWKDLLAITDALQGLVERHALYGRRDEAAMLVDVRDTVAGALALVEPHVARRGVLVDAALPREPALAVVRDAGLRQIVVNLVTNAVDAASTTPNRVVEVHFEVDDDELLLRVRDRGDGLPDEVRERLFEPFVTTKPHGEGTGLGLYITRLLVQEMGGVLQLVSDGRGTEASVRLPRRRDG